MCVECACVAVRGAVFGAREGRDRARGARRDRRRVQDTRVCSRRMVSFNFLCMGNSCELTPCFFVTGFRVTWSVLWRDSRTTRRLNRSSRRLAPWLSTANPGRSFRVSPRRRWSIGRAVWTRPATKFPWRRRLRCGGSCSVCCLWWTTRSCTRCGHTRRRLWYPRGIGHGTRGSQRRRGCGRTMTWSGTACSRVQITDGKTPSSSGR